MEIDVLILKMLKVTFFYSVKSFWFELLYNPRWIYFFHLCIENVAFIKYISFLSNTLNWFLILIQNNFFFLLQILNSGHPIKCNYGLNPKYQHGSYPKFQMQISYFPKRDEIFQCFPKKSSSADYLR